MASQMRTEMLNEAAAMGNQKAPLDRIKGLIEATSSKLAMLADCPEEKVMETLYPKQDPRDEIRDWSNANCSAKSTKSVLIACSFLALQKEVENIRSYFRSQGFQSQHMAWIPRYKDVLLGESRTLPMYHKYLLNLEKLQVASLFLVTEFVKSHPFRHDQRVVNYVIDTVVQEISLDEITRLSRTCRYKSFLQYRGLAWIDIGECRDMDGLLAAWVRRSPELSPEIHFQKLGRRNSDFSEIRLLNDQLAGLNFSGIGTHPLPYLFATKTQFNHILPKFQFEESELEILWQWIQLEPLEDGVVQELYRNAMKIETRLLNCQDIVAQLTNLLHEQAKTADSEILQKLDLNQCAGARFPNIWHLLGLKMWLVDSSLSEGA